MPGKNKTKAHSTAKPSFFSMHIYVWSYLLRGWKDTDQSDASGYLGGEGKS